MPRDPLRTEVETKLAQLVQKSAEEAAINYSIDNLNYFTWRCPEMRGIQYILAPQATIPLRDPSRWTQKEKLQVLKDLNEGRIKVKVMTEAERTTWQEEQKQGKRKVRGAQLELSEDDNELLQPIDDNEEPTASTTTKKRRSTSGEPTSSTGGLKSKKVAIVMGHEQTSETYQRTKQLHDQEDAGTANTGNEQLEVNFVEAANMLLVSREMHKQEITALKAQNVLLQHNMEERNKVVNGLQEDNAKLLAEVYRLTTKLKEYEDRAIMDAEIQLLCP